MKPGRISLAAFAGLGLLSVPVQAETIQVIVDKLVFAPVDVNAKVGDTVEWSTRTHSRTPRRRQTATGMSPLPRNRTVNWC